MNSIRPFQRITKIAYALVMIITAALSNTNAGFAADCTVIAPDLVSWWPGDDDAKDIIGQSAGVLYGGATFTNGLVGRAFRFDGINGHVRIADNPSLHFTNAITVETWVNPSSGYGGNVIVKWDAVQGPQQRAYGLTVGVIGGFACPAFGVSPTGGDDPVPVIASIAGTNMSLPLNQWSHLAGTYDGTALRIYVNGIERGEVPYSNGIFPGTDDLAIGAAVGGLAPGSVLGPFAGLIDEPALYNRALTAAEIQAIFSVGSAGKCGPLRITHQPQSQLGYWGKSAMFTVEASGLPPISYQWQKDGTQIPGATDPSLTLTNLLMTDGGSYSVVVTNVQGSLTSKPAILTVNPAGVSVDLHIAVTIEGVVGYVYGVQSTTDLSNTNSWQGLTNITLSLPTQAWFDPEPATRPQRFYRVVPGPITIP
jgi:hypothetical protein